MRFFSVLVAGVCAAASAMASAATPAALVLGFEAAPEPILLSLSTAARVVPTRPISGPQWTITATDSIDTTLWSRPLPAPQQFHADTAITFPVVVPRPAPGTRLSLRDETGRERWQAVIDQAVLDIADAAGRQVEAKRAEAAVATAALASHAADPALRKQLELGHASGNWRERPDARPAEHDENAAAKLHQRANETRSATREPAGPATKAATAIVAARVVDETGRAPGVAFNGRLSDDKGASREVHVGADGALSLPLEAGTAYRLELSPPAPLVGKPFRFTYAGGPLADFVLEHGWLVDITLKDAVRGSVIAAEAQHVSIWASTTETSYVVRASDGHVRTAVSRNGNLDLRMQISGLPGYAEHIVYPIGRISGDFRGDASLAPAHERPVRVSMASGARLPGPTGVHCQSQFLPGMAEYEGWARMDADGTGSLSLPDGRTYICSVNLSDPGYWKSFSGIRLSATPTTFTLPPTNLVHFNLFGEDARPFADNVSAEWTAPDATARSYCWSNPCTLRVPADSAAAVRFAFSTEFLAFTVGPEVFPANAQRTLIVKRQHRLSGKVVNPLDTYSYPRVRALDAADGRFVLSTRTNWIGEYELPLTAGTYVLEVDSNNDDGGRGNFYYRQPQRTQPIVVSSSQGLPDIVLGTAQGEFVLFATGPCSLFGPPPRGVTGAARLMTADGTRIHRAANLDYTISGPSLPSGQCANAYRMLLTPGTYDIAFAPLGWPLRQLRSVRIEEGTRTTAIEEFAAKDRSLVWKTRILGTSQAPLRKVAVTLYDDTQEAFGTTEMAANANIEISFQEGWSVEIAAPAEGTSVRRLVRFGTDPLPAQVSLDALDLDPVAEGGLLRLYGNGDREHRFNILFLAESFVQQRESFTDTNGNGTWDGVVWYDVDGDGVYSPPDLVNIYGSVTRYPEYGTVPTRDNEPFVDLNGDGVPNLDDPALFVENARAFMRSLLGADFWNEHHDAFNAYLMFQPSPQAGFSVRNEDGTVALERSTRYGATLELGRGTLQLERSAASNDAIAALPEVDLAVIVVNNPFNSGRSNITNGQPGSMIYAGGPSKTSPNDMTATHEMGHFIGTLCDEYEELGGFSPQIGQSSSWCGNVGYSPAQVPWQAWLSPGFTAPSRGFDGTTGIFEGAAYYPGGAYRPSLRSTMRFLSPYFNEPSRAALLQAVKDRTATNQPADHRLRSPPIVFSRVRKPNSL